MEDISRELEREIAKSKPKPFRKNRKIKILIVDDFGRIISGDKMKFFFIIISFISVATLITSIVYYYRYTHLLKETSSDQEKLVFAEKKISELISEKEFLMARLVILGKEPGIKKQNEKNEKTGESKTAPLESTDKEEDQKHNAAIATGKEKNIENPGIDLTAQAASGTQGITESKAGNKTVSIEKFTVTKNRTNRDLLVQFGVRNISREQGISGRIFTVLRPDNDIEEQWLVVPSAKLKKGVPIENQNGQYFSIAYFKPVKFKIKSEVNSDFYKKASIFVFNIEGELVFEKMIDITEAE